MGFDQYHEPANEPPQEVRTFARVIASLTEEAEAIGWYEQRLANAQGEEFKHFGMDLEFLLRPEAKVARRVTGYPLSGRRHCRTW